MSKKVKLLTAAVTAALGMGFATQAAANVYALSSLSIDNLNIVLTPNNAVDIDVTGFNFTLRNTADLNGSGVIINANCGGLIGANSCSPTGNVLNAAPANAPGGTVIRTDNTLSGGTLYALGPAGDQYATSDSVIVTAELVNLGSPTSTHQIAESELQSAGTAGSAAIITSGTGLSVDFATTGAFDFDLSFLADIDMRVLINAAPGSYSESNSAVSITLRQLGTAGQTLGSVSWSPQGSTANDCSVTGSFIGVITCTEAADTEDLNNNLNLFANGNTEYSPGPGASGFFDYGFLATGFGEGTYNLALSADTNVFIRQAVPEPATLALLGAGLAGLGFAGRRQRKHA